VESKDAGRGDGAGFSVGVLGPLLVRCGGAAVPVPAPKQRVILAALAFRAGQALSYDELAEIVWDGAPPEAARVAIRNYVKRLRRVLGPVAGQRILTRDPGYALDAVPGEVDALRFTAVCLKAAEAARQAQEAPGADAKGAQATWDGLSAALDLWRGDPLADVPSHLLVAAEVPRLDALRMQALEWRIDAGLVLGRHAELAGELAQLTAEHPLRERFHAQLMLALYRCGRQAEALEAYQRARRLLVDELGVEPGHELQDLQGGILAGDARLAAPGPVLTSLVPAGVVPRQLPAGVAHFTGRVAELAALRAWQREAAGAGEAVRITVIGGTAGSGKTALAVHWAHQAAAEFPDGQLYVNLRGFDPSGTPVAPGDALRWFLGAFGVTEERMPKTPDEQAAMYRSLLAGRRVLVILDNARDAAQVRPLLPGSPSCLAVVTSRARLPGLAAIEGARLVPLDVLTAIDARELLAGRLGKRARAEVAAVHQLTELCSRLPLALSIVAARAAASPLLPLAGLARELADTQGRLDALDAGDPAASVRAVFSWSCRQLSEPAARLFRLLGVHAGPDISLAAAASLAGLAPSRARLLIAELADANLVAEPAPGRYAFHDLLRAYSADLSAGRGGEAERHDAQRRVLDHYLHTAYAGSRVLNPARLHVVIEPPAAGVTPERITSASEAMGWFDAERQVLLAAVTQASDLGLDSYAWQLPWTLMLFFDRQGFWHDQIAIQHIAIAAAKRLADLPGQARAYRDLGTAFVRLGALADAHAYYSQALDLHQQLGNLLGQAHAHNEIMFVAERQGQLAEALDHAQQSLTLFQAAGNQPGVAKALNAVGWQHAQRGDYEQALHYCERALSLGKGAGDPLNEACTWDSMGYAHYQLGRYGEAIRCLRTATQIMDGLSAGLHEPPLLIHLGDACEAAGDHESARQAWLKALAILEELRQPEADQVRARLSGYFPVGASRAAIMARSAGYATTG
jgi:DNA-binding SARP family transcriptional activator/Flp pilus assembly protein TadD